MTAGAAIADRAEFGDMNRARRPLLGKLASLGRFAVGVVLCLTPVTAVLVLGWVVNTRTLAAPGVMLNAALVAPVTPVAAAVRV